MELAITAISAIGQGIGSLLGIGGTTAATTAATGATAAAGSSAALTGLQAFTTVLSALGTIGAGAAAASESRQQADVADLQAGQEKVAATQRQTQMKRSLLQVLGENDVAFASAGIDLNGGIAQSSRANAEKQATEQLTIDRRDQEFRSALYRVRAQDLRRRASSQMGGALLGALGDIGNLALGAGSRGTGTSGSSGGYDPWAGLRIANG